MVYVAYDVKISRGCTLLARIFVQFVLPFLERIAASGAFLKYALARTCMRQFPFMSGSHESPVRYVLKRDICLAAKGCAPSLHKNLRCMCCYLCFQHW